MTRWALGPGGRHSCEACSPLWLTATPLRCTQVFDPARSQDAVFEDTKHLIQSAVDGFNVCIFAYGQVRLQMTRGAPNV